MIIIKGQSYPTIAEASNEIGVSAKTVRQYIARKIISEPPVIEYGNRSVKYFPADYMALAKKMLKAYRRGRGSSG